MKEVTNSAVETAKLAERVLNNLKVGKNATILALYGDLGSGKTTFVKGLANFLGVKDNVVSPTFIIERIYDTKNKKFKKLIHVDVYRFEEPHDIEQIEWKKISKDPYNLIAIEWAEKVEKEMPEDARKIFFRHIEEYKREIEW